MFLVKERGRAAHGSGNSGKPCSEKVSFMTSFSSKVPCCPGACCGLEASGRLCSWLAVLLPCSLVHCWLKKHWNGFWKKFYEVPRKVLSTFRKTSMNFSEMFSEPFSACPGCSNPDAAVLPSKTLGRSSPNLGRFFKNLWEACAGFPASAFPWKARFFRFHQAQALAGCIPKT